MRVVLVVLGLCVLVLAGALSLWLAPARHRTGFPQVPIQQDRAHPQGDVCRSPVNQPTSLNPFTTTDPVGVRYVLAYTHDTLFDRDPQTGALRPAAATGYTSEGDTLRFSLRDDLRFADGSAVTVEDLRFTLQVAGHPLLRDGSDMSYYVGRLARASAPDATTLEFTRAADDAEPTAEELATAVRIVQRRWFMDQMAALAPAVQDDAARAIDEDFVRSLAGLRDCGPGTGPHRVAPGLSLADAEQLGHLDLPRNPHCWRRVAAPEAWNLAGLQLRFGAEESLRLAALRAGEVDWFNPSGGTTVEALLEQHPELRADFVAHRYEPGHIHSYQVIWNCGRKPLDQAAVRRALARLFDRETILREVFAGVGSLPRGFYKPGDPGAQDSPEPFGFNALTARELLAEAGCPAGTRIEVLFPNVSTMRRILDLAQPAFTAAGLELVATPLDPQSLAARRDAGDFDAYLHVAARSHRPDPTTSFGADSNDFGYRSEAFEELARALSAAGDDLDRRTAIERRIQALLHHEQPVTFLIHPRIELLMHRRFHAATPGPLGLHFEPMWVPLAEQVFRAQD